MIRVYYPWSLFLMNLFFIYISLILYINIRYYYSKFENVLININSYVFQYKKGYVNVTKQNNNGSSVFYYYEKYNFNSIIVMNIIQLYYIQLF